MKLLPGLTTFNNLFDDMFDDSFFRSYNSYMKTDIKEVDNQYVINQLIMMKKIQKVI